MRVRGALCGRMQMTRSNYYIYTALFAHRTKQKCHCYESAPDKTMPI